MLAHPEVDVVCIATPVGQRAEQAIRAAQAGKHVLVENPMALSQIQADAMVRACQVAGVKLGVVCHLRSNILYRRIYDAIQGGDLGELTIGLVTMPYYRSPEHYAQTDRGGTWARDGGGVLMNEGIHLLDLLVWYMGDPVGVQAYAGTLHRQIEVEDTLVATLHFAQGAMATIAATNTAMDGYPHRVEIYGTNGGIRTEGDVLTDWRIVNLANSTVAAPKRSEMVRTGAGGVSHGVRADDHIGVFQDFIQAIQDDRSPCVSGEEGRRSVATVSAIYAAAGLRALS